MERLKERFGVAQRALANLREVLAETNPLVIVRDAAIQRFEYTFEAVWKAGQEFLRTQEGIDVGSPIGEAAAHMPEEIVAGHPEIPWQDMRDMRNVLAHEYFGINEKIVWETIQNDLSSIVPDLKNLLRKQGA